MQNHSYENKFDLHENERVCRTHFNMNGFALKLIFDTEVKGRHLRNGLLGTGEFSAGQGE